MKKNILGLIISGLFLVNTGMVLADSIDIPATLSISGTVKSNEISCMVSMDKSSVSLIEKPESLIKQGDNATSPEEIHLSVVGDDRCDALISEGHIAYKVLGVADNADGTALANSITDESAAKGVGVGIFDADKKPVSINTGLLSAHEDTVFGLQMVQLTNQQAVAGNLYATASVQIERL
ncbi:fimbrial protein [Citrobacter farmeri]|uniref:Fimbrial protein n=1 Tax=Citrobacter amalonaticus Y19 TaxID=1261127 RepID=A0A0F6RH65_CITAM|nr:fimbrial protein [Citrobacter amalonaticus]AKE60653.1 fimbrial protein [Citrobacter amalonaticus Y19]EKV5655554.1 fimbrial protein [Citrobacter farmeri]